MKFNKSVLVIGSLGELKAYKVVKTIGIDRHQTAQVSHVNNQGEQKESTQLELITDINYIEPRKKIKDIQSDQSGRFGGQVGASTGEEHDTALERDERTLKEISKEIKKIIEKEAPSAWHLAFPKESHKKLEELLSANIKKTLVKIVPSNLTKTPKEKLLSHFE